MAYGSGRQLGETINPQLMNVDFSAYERAGATTGNALANLGQQIGSTVKEYSNNEKEIKKAIQISSAIEKIPGLAPMAQEALSKLSDPNLSQRDRLAVAESIKDSLNIGITGLQEQRTQEEFNMRKAAAGAAAGARAAAQAKEIQEAQNLLKGFPSQIALLEASGFAAQAKVLRDQYDLALANNDVNTATTIAGQASGFAANLKPSTLQPEAALKIQQDQLALEAAKIQASMQGKARNIMTADQLQQQIQSGAKVKYIPLGNGMYEVESATANELPMFGNVTVGPDGKIQQVPSGRGNIRIPGAGAGIQNALPTRDDIAPNMPPYVQRVLKDVNNGFTYGTQVNNQPVIPIGEVPESDVYTIKDGEVGVTRLPGSTAELEYKAKAADLAVKQAELAKQQALTKDVTEKQQIKEKGKKNFSDYIGEMARAYSNLYKKGGAVAGGESSLGAYVGGTETGQMLSRISGSEAQVYRDVINSMAPNLINIVRQSSEMGAKGLDSEKELKFYLGAIGDPTRPIEANLKAIDVLDKAYGDGNAVYNMLIENPELLRKVKEYGLKFDSKEEKAAGSTPLDTNPEVEQMLKELGL